MDLDLRGPAQKGLGVHGQYVYWIAMSQPSPAMIEHGLRLRLRLESKRAQGAQIWRRCVWGGKRTFGLRLAPLCFCVWTQCLIPFHRVWLAFDVRLDTAFQTHVWAPRLGHVWHQCVYVPGPWFQQQ